MSRRSFFKLHSILQPHIQKQQTHLRPTVPSDLRLAIFLYHIAQGAGYLVVSDSFAVGRSTVSKIVGEVARAIVNHLSIRYVRFPTIEEATRTMEYFRSKSGIPGVVACIDGCHISIIKPAHSGTAYCNRKGFYSINVQGTTTIHLEVANYVAPVDHKRRFVELTVGWPGSVADGRVFANSFLNANVERLLSSLRPTPMRTMNPNTKEVQYEDVPAFILSDSAYCSDSRMVPTFKNTDCSHCGVTRKLNAKLAGIRYYIENAFGILKGRFRILLTPLKCTREDFGRATWKGGMWSELNRTKVYSISKKLSSAKVSNPLYLNSSHVVRAKPLHSSLHQKRSPSLKKNPFLCQFHLYSSTISPSMSSSFTHESSESG